MIWLLLPGSRTTREFLIPDFDPCGIEIESGQYGEIWAKLDWPAAVHVGKPSEIQFFLEPSEGLQKAAGGLLEECNLMAEVRIDAPLLEVSPQGNISQPFKLQGPINFQWEVEADQTGLSEAQFWFYLVYVSADGGVDRHPQLSVPIEIQKRALAGVSDQYLVWCALIFLILSMILLLIRQ